MNILITSEEVLSLAFNDIDEVDVSVISETEIAAAEYKHIKPVMGRLYEKLLEPRYSIFLNEYIKPALALYIKLSILPLLVARVGNMGVVQYRSGSFSAVTPVQLKALVLHTKSTAQTLLRRAVEHIENNLTLYPDYDPAENILSQISIEGGFVL